MKSKREKTSGQMSVPADQDRVSLPDKIFVQMRQGHVNDSTINKMLWYSINKVLTVRRMYFVSLLIFIPVLYN